MSIVEHADNLHVLVAHIGVCFLYGGYFVWLQLSLKPHDLLGIATAIDDSAKLRGNVVGDVAWLRAAVVRVVVVYEADSLDLETGWRINIENGMQSRRISPKVCTLRACQDQAKVAKRWQVRDHSDWINLGPAAVAHLVVLFGLASDRLVREFFAVEIRYAERKSKAAILIILIAGIVKPVRKSHERRMADRDIFDHVPFISTD